MAANEHIDHELSLAAATALAEAEAKDGVGNDTRVLEYGEQELADTAEEPLLAEALREDIELSGSRRTLRRLIQPGIPSMSTTKHSRTL